jgi:acyl carrier protein
MELAEQVRDVIIEGLHLDEGKRGELKPDTPLFGAEGLGLDSIDALELVVLLRKHFKVDVKDREAGQRAFKNFGSLVEFVRLGQRPGG